MNSLNLALALQDLSFKGNLERHSASTDQLEITVRKAVEILGEIMQFRRMAGECESCNAQICEQCLTPHLSKVINSIVKHQPISLVLPAFPGKSPNPAKVLGVLPDLAERKALKFLNELCEGIKGFHAPGAKIILCSDGRVFSDVVGMQEDDVTAYQDGIDQIIEELNLTNIETFNLDELCDGRDFHVVRQELMTQYSQPLEELRNKVRRGGKASENSEDIEAHRMYCGITRFLFEDSLTPNQTKSRTALQKDARARAYEVIRRSNAWSELIAEKFPQAVRLSIHPQACGSKKMGIQLLDASSWMTPWHGVAVDNGSEIVLMKRWEAEQLGAVLVTDSADQPSHFNLALAEQAV